MASAITRSEMKQVDELVKVYLEGQKICELFRRQIVNEFEESKELQQLIHSIKSRLKDPDHLRDKLRRKLQGCKDRKEEFNIDEKNLFSRVNDLVGIRLLHLHTTQIQAIDGVIKNIFQEMGIELREGPTARTWDDESRSFFSKIGIATQTSPTMYTSVHYVVASSSRTLVTCEIQIRTLMEEVWGEVDHSINYPHKIDSVPCTEQILALARSTSSATRLVDAIFATVADIEARKASNTSAKEVRKRKASPRKTNRATRSIGSKAPRRK